MLFFHLRSQKENKNLGICRLEFEVSDFILTVPKIKLTFSCLLGQFKPSRSIVFASWSAGDFGAIGATEWLEVFSIYYLNPEWALKLVLA